MAAAIKGPAMRTTHQILTALACLFAANGCLARQVTRDGEGLRRALLTMYTDQVMDNLVRARRQEPFVQLKYHDLMVQDQDKTNVAALGETGTIGNSRSALQRMFTRSFMGAFPVSGSFDRNRTLTFHADPITDQNYIYEKYLTFAGNENLLRVTCEKPTCGVHMMRECHGEWYWIPLEAAEDFAALVLATSVGSPPSQTGYWATTVDKVDVRYGPNGIEIKNKYILTFTTEVPNGPGMVIFTAGEKHFALILEGLDELPFAALKDIPEKDKDKPQVSRPGPLPGAPTKMLYTQWNIKDISPTELKGAKAMILSDDYPKTTQSGPGDLQKIANGVENIRVLLNRSTIISQ